MYTSAPTVAADITHISANMREADIAEVRAVGRKPMQSLLDGWELSDKCETIFVDGEPAAMWGVAPSDWSRGTIWLLGTDRLTENPTTFLRGAKRKLSHALRSYSTLENYVSETNSVHLRWLEWLGATFGKRHEIGGVPFIHFEIKNNV